MFKHSKTQRWIFGSTIILLAVFCISVLSLEGNSVYFYTPAEAVKNPSNLRNREIRVGGMVQGNSVQWQPENLDLRFTLTDLKGVEIKVKHKGTPPDMFKENSGVIVEGKLSPTGESFTAYRLFVKHSEEYKVPGSSPSQDHQLLQKSILKNESTL